MRALLLLPALLGCTAAVADAERPTIIVESTHCYVLQTPYFPRDSAALSAGTEEIVAAMASALRESPEEPAIVALTGHASAGEQDPLVLSVRRAETVRAVLVALGIAPERVRVQGFGARCPVDSNDSAEGRAYNQRVETRLIRASDVDAGARSCR